MNRIYNDNIKAYSSLYKDDEASKSYEVRVKVDILNKIKLKSQGNLLEIGYGTGDLMHVIANKYPKLAITGIEIVKDAEELYRRRYPKDKNVNLILTKAESGMKLRKESFDIIMSSHVLEHVENEEYFLKEVYKSLKKNGQFILAVPDWGDFENHLHYRQYRNGSLKEFSKYGFKVVEVKGDGFYLNKIFYISLQFLQRIIGKKRHEAITSRKKTNKKEVTGITTQIYYEIFVPFMLFINRIDSFLFARIDKKPMQWIAIFKK